MSVLESARCMSTLHAPVWEDGKRILEEALCFLHATWTCLISIGRVNANLLAAQRFSLVSLLACRDGNGVLCGQGVELHATAKMVHLGGCHGCVALKLTGK